MNVRAFQDKIFSHYHAHGRKLPWRETTDPYKILLSEVMLQQTQVSRGESYYLKWTRRWPDIHSLAHANRKDVLSAWIGLGYNNRAIRLHETAKIISKDYDGNVLAAMHAYKKLPGIGPYTARAVRIFSANEDIITVDTNIRRILIHEFELDEHVSDKELERIALACLPKGKSRDWHNALMDYGATLLTSRKSGIKPKTRQSKFEGSDRQIRARVLKDLLAQERDLRGLQRHCQERPRLNKILASMIKDKLIKEKKGKYSLHDGD